KDGAPSILEMTYNLSLANIVPAASSFSVQVNSAARSVSSVSVSGTKVLLTLSSPVAYGNTVTVAYNKPSTNPLQTAAGGQAATISAQSVTNRIAAPPPATPVYVSSVIENTAPSVIEITYNLALANIVPAISAFNVQVNSTARSISSVSVSGTKVLLSLAIPVAYGNTVTVAYTKPSTNPLQTAAGGQAATISAQSVTNRIAAPPPPPAPVYVSSVVENTAPSVIEITYNLALANIVPAVSAFTVQVNSTTRSISTVSVSGTKVLLSLAIPVAYGNTVTVAYTKPSTNPLQTAAGGQAATISAQSVTNRISQPVSPPAVVTPPPTTPNSPPVPVVNFPERTYSGFIGDISAKGSYDPDMDKLSFSWKTPDNIPVSSNTGEAIQFLAPVIDTKQTYEFALTVSDGKTTQTKTFPITIIPYEPYLEAAEVISVSASDFHSTNHPYNVVDGNITTMWSSKGEEQSLILELKSPFIIHHIKIAFQPGQKSESYFDIYGSNDGENWESILEKAKSCSFSGGIHVFVFPLSKAVTEYSYLKFVGLGNSTDNWNYVSELRIFGYRHKSRTDYEDLIVKLFPNPARDIVNIRIDDPEFNPDFIKILGLDGKIIYSDLVEPGVRDFQIPVNFKHGVYIVQMGTDNITMFTQKLVVSR
ncbi:MAG TPA: SwmB domain-containing protein, partial [Bacteroidales bacterium]|nr:SwmB domain-containing protein [Bacteroidales bacterium]